MGNLAPAALAGSLADLVSGICLKIGGALVVVAAADYGFQRWRYELSLQMTPDEMREEMRSQNGDPAVQRRRRQLQGRLALTHLESAVAQAQLVLVQGTSWAVALQYDPRTMSAPIVVAKGSGDAAAKIRQTAERAKIRVVQEPRLDAGHRASNPRRRRRSPPSTTAPSPDCGSSPPRRPIGPEPKHSRRAATKRSPAFRKSRASGTPRNF